MFAKIPFELLKNEEITAGDIAVYAALGLFADFESGECYPSLTSIASFAKLSRNSAVAKIKNLERLGFVVADRNNGRQTRYRLCFLGAPEPVSTLSIPVSTLSIPVSTLSTTSTRIDTLTRSNNKNQLTRSNNDDDAKQKKSAIEDLKKEWAITLSHLGGAANMAPDTDYQLASLLRVKSFEELRMAIVGMRLEEKTDRYNPAKFVSLYRLYKPATFDKMRNLGAMEEARLSAKKKQPQSESEFLAERLKKLMEESERENA